MDIKQAFAAVLKDYRKKRKLTQEQLAEKASVARMYLWRMEQGEHSPSLDTIFQLAEALDIKPNKFVEEIRKIYKDE